MFRRKFKLKRNSQQDIVEFLEKNKFKSEKEIQTELWCAYLPDKKYADILRRALHSGKIKRVRMKIHSKDKRMIFRYYI